MMMAATPDPPPPGETSDDTTGERREVLAALPVLRFLWLLAVLGALATLVGRMIAPSVAGVTVGIEGLVLALDRAGGTLSQLFALFSVVSAVSLVFMVVQTPAPVALRVFAVVATSLAVVEVIVASGRERVPDLMALTSGGVTASLSLLAAWDARRSVFSRQAGLVLGLAGTGALLRVVAALVADSAVSGASLAIGSIARGIATGAFAFDGLAALTAVAGLRKRSEAGGSGGGGGAGSGEPPQQLFSPLILLALALAFVVTRYAAGAGSSEAHPVELLLFRALERLSVRPVPAAPVGAQHFVAALSIVVALLALAARRPTPALSAVVALAMLGRGMVGAPLGSMSLALASLGVVLAARDERGLWAALLGSQARRAPAGGAGQGIRGQGAPEQGVRGQGAPGRAEVREEPPQ
ncbi:hypothetical protein [Chondromyces apiculatus]|uniref:Uncharacterized protein n=1 Tax=Chondromyces apiculatus DSM 436 TaxID=1192034 RepID=A0A017TDN2_9BACT|nr:hypothetical protein [Chondromyces apiculatus]EYF07403.1 Hypothetical protein CAP_0156 [Chondromyces apiculatus DSM 436]